MQTLGVSESGGDNAPALCKDGGGSNEWRGEQSVASEPHSQFQCIACIRRTHYSQDTESTSLAISYKRDVTTSVCDNCVLVVVTVL